MDDLYIGPVPCDEDCEQLGEGYRPERARQECRAYIGQLRRIHGAEPDGTQLRIKSNLHDFGTYLEVVVRYNENIQAAVDYAFRVEANCPAEWDDEARRDLGLA